METIPAELQTYDAIIGEDLFINQLRISKFIKRRFKKIFLNPSLLLSKNRTIKFHFDMMHGDGNLDKAISVLDANEQNDFKDLSDSLLKEIPDNLKSYESIIGEDFYVNKFRFTKFIKKKF